MCDGEEEDAKSKDLSEDLSRSSRVVKLTKSTLVYDLGRVFSLNNVLNGNDVGNVDVEKSSERPKILPWRKLELEAALVLS